MQTPSAVRGGAQIDLVARLRRDGPALSVVIPGQLEIVIAWQPQAADAGRSCKSPMISASGRTIRMVGFAAVASRRNWCTARGLLAAPLGRMDPPKWGLRTSP